MDTQAAKENKVLWNRKKPIGTFLVISGSQSYSSCLIQKAYEEIRSLSGQTTEENLKSLKSCLEICACVYGGSNIEEKNEAIQRFKRGDIQYLVANPASADKGLTLTNCHKVIYFSLNYSYELFKQSYDRVYGDRSIQPNFCDYYIMIANGTIDAVLYNDVLTGKRWSQVMRY